MQNKLLKPLKNLYNRVSGTIASGFYHKAALRNTYPCRLVGERPTTNPNETIIVYRILGKRDIIEIPVRKLLDNRDLLAKFHPVEAVKLGAIAMGDTLSGLPKEKLKQEFEQMKKKMLKHSK